MGISWRCAVEGTEPGVAEGRGDAGAGEYDEATVTNSGDDLFGTPRDMDLEMSASIDSACGFPEPASVAVALGRRLDIVDPSSVSCLSGISCNDDPCAESGGDAGGVIVGGSTCQLRRTQMVQYQWFCPS
jgi:hypothetical protein